MSKGAWFLIVLSIWGVGGLILYYGLRTNRCTHKKRDYLSAVPDVTGDSIGGFIFGILFSLLIGSMLKIMPWWMAKTLFIAMGLAIIGFGFRTLVHVL